MILDMRASAASVRAHDGGAIGHKVDLAGDYHGTTRVAGERDCGLACGVNAVGGVHAARTVEGVFGAEELPTDLRER